MNNPKILISTQMMINNQSRFSEWLTKLGFEPSFIMNEQFLTESECLKIPNHFDGWISGDDEITSKVIDHFTPSLKIISKWGTGIDSIDLVHAQRKNLKICNSPGAFKYAVSELAVAYLLNLVRGVLYTHNQVLNNAWPKIQFASLEKMNVGIIGFGSIGSQIAEKLKPFGCNIYYFDKNVNDSNYISLNLNDLLNQCEALIFSCDLNKSSVHMINDKNIKKLRKGIFIVNVSRGPILKESSLLFGLENKIINGLAMDVYETEPLPENSKLRKYNNVIFGSHNANNTFSAVEFTHQNTINQLVSFFNCNDY